MKRIKIFIILVTLYLSQNSISNAQDVNSQKTKAEIWADSVMNRMSLNEKIGQMFMIAAYSNKSQKHIDEISYIIKKYKVGGVIFFQGGPLRQAKQTNHYQKISKIPLLIAIDGEWGLGMRLDSTINYPRQMMLGAIQNDSLIYQMGKDIAKQMQRLGIHINFAPVVDVNNNSLNPVINVRSFGENRENVSNKSIAYMNGMQDNGLMTTAKHFPGHGDTHSDSHHTLPFINHNTERLDSVELYPFKKLFKAGVTGVMVAHLNVPELGTSNNTPTTLTKQVVTDLLQKQMGFEGLIFTDALNMKGVTKYFGPGKIEAMAVKAGNDVLLFPVSVSKAITQIKRQVKKGNISKERIEKSCKKILLAKYNAGLLDKQTLNEVNLDSLTKDLNKPEYNKTKLDIIQSSITVIRNQEDLLPIKKLRRKKIASIALNTKQQTKFQQTLSKYTNIDHFVSSEGISDSLQKALAKYDLVIASIHNTSYWPSKNYKVNPKYLRNISDLALKTKVVFSLFANPYSLRNFKRIDDINSVIIAYDDSDETECLVAQAIFGGFSVSGKLPVSINSEYKGGTGIELKKKIRLQYGIPEQIGINSQKLLKIDSIALDAIKQKATPGCQVLIARKGVVFYDKVFGHHTYLEKQEVKHNDIYDIASITKIASTVPSLMRLYEQGKIDIEGKLSDYLPELDTTNKGNLLIKDILTHQARLNGWIPFYYSTLSTLYPQQKLLSNKFSEEYPYKLGKHAFVAKNTIFKDGIYSFYPKKGYTINVAKDFYLNNSFRDSIYNKIGTSDLLEKKEYRYSDLGYYYFHKIIENITHSPFQNYVDSIFFEELGATRTSFLPLKKFNKDEIIPTENDQLFRKQLLQGYVHDPGAAMLGGVCGHAGLFSTANDLAKLMQMFLRGGNYGGTKYFDKETILLFTTSPFLDQDNRRALGFDKPQIDHSKPGPTSESASPKSFGHSGFTGTIAWVDPEEEIVYIFLSNRIHPDQDNNKLLMMNVRTNIQEAIYNSLNTNNL